MTAQKSVDTIDTIAGKLSNYEFRDYDNSPTTVMRTLDSRTSDATKIYLFLKTLINDLKGK